MVESGKILYEKSNKNLPPAVPEYLTKKSQIEKTQKPINPQRKIQREIIHKPNQILIFIAMAGLLFSLFLSTSTITGYTIEPISETIPIPTRVIFFTIGLILSLYILKRK